MDRRRSTRLSGENASTNGTTAPPSADTPLVGSSSSTTVTTATTGSAMLIGGPQKGATAHISRDVVEDLGMSGTSNEEQPAKKRQKTTTTTTTALNILKAPTRKAKAPAFKPTVLATTSLGEPSANGSTTHEPTNNGVRPPPPPPSERRPARRRSSAEAMLKRLQPSPSSLPPMNALPITRHVTEPYQSPTAGIRASQPSRNAEGKKGRKAGSGAAGAAAADADGLDGWGTSLEAELGNERGRWKDMIVQGDPTPVKSNGNQTESQLLDLLDFGEPEEALASAPKPLTPPRSAAATMPSTLYQTPSRRSRRYTVAPPHTGDASAAGGENTTNESMIPLPIEDTPMIRRNQEMRERASRRRSSTSNRGSRMSENLGRGDISVPHPAVPSEKWYKHIGSSYPEPVRVRHLLLWALKKAAMEGESAEQSAAGVKDSGKASRSRSKGKGKETAKRTPEGDGIVKAIMDTVTGQMARGEIDTNIFALPGELKETPGALRAHPRNMANREYQAATTDFINRQKAESAQWSSIINEANARRNKWLARYQERVAEFEQERLRYELPEELPSRIPQLHEWSALVHEVLEDETELMELDAEDIEIKIDMIHQNTYAATHFSAQVTRFLDGIFAAFTQDLRNQDQIELGTSEGVGATDSKTPANVFASTSAAAQSKPRRDPLDLLRALAAAEATHQSEETLSAASALPVVPSAISMRAGSNVGNLASVLMTPRRQAVMTPRRAPAMGTTPRRLPMLGSAAKGASTTSASPSRRN
ncbi:hypothetical protein QFC21_000089 [Naganishia friedmannii]|uniref:Uncharacterized protein n=1 Tax=Naganishia friedmannii TaxID=89922 RepID=A0ACC2WC06_9TREE|nr:hypothetical protein QFC21_000089 [Naganishia friedmannii]